MLALSNAQSLSARALRSVGRARRPARRVASQRQEQDTDSETTSVSRRAALSASAASALALIHPSTARAGFFSAEPPPLPAWTRVPLPVDSDVVFLDVGFVPAIPKRGWLLGTQKTLLRTDDGGDTWRDVDIPGAFDEDTEQGLGYRLTSVSFAKEVPKAAPTDEDAAPAPSSSSGALGYIVGSPSILLRTEDGGDSWKRVSLSSRLPGKPSAITALEGSNVELTTDQGAIYFSSDAGETWRASVSETVEATLNRTVSSGISGASYYTGTFQTMARNTIGEYVAVNARGNFYLTWTPGDGFWTPHNRSSARRIQSMGWTPDNGLWLTTRGGGLFLNDERLSEEFSESQLPARGYGVLDVAFDPRSPKTAFACGGSGSLFRSNDGARTWERDTTTDKVGANLYDVQYAPSGTGWILGNAGVVLRST